ncbi:hypothetical protein GJ496_011062 [Pomphorhynchus laevis]|nr:hypothetical protein GJ496_011062 [Pomphorhynchus laevis]
MDIAQNDVCCRRICFNALAELDSSLTFCCDDKATRFNLPTFCPDGLHLVRLLTRSIYTFASNLLNLQVSIEDLYAKKLKAISICLRITYLILSQSIVNLGIFTIYNDHCVNNVLEALAALCIRIQPETELLIYPKLVNSYFTLMQELAIAKIDFFIALSPQVFTYVIVTIQVGLNMPDAIVIMRSCSVLFSILMYIFDCDNKRKRVDNTVQLQNLVQQNMTIFDQIMETALTIVVYEQNFKLNYISDSFLLLILLNQKGFNRLYERFVQDMNLDEDSSMALSLFTEFSTRATELSPPNSSSEFLELLMSLRRELSLLMNTPIKEDTSDMLV